MATGRGMPNSRVHEGEWVLMPLALLHGNIPQVPELSIQLFLRNGRVFTSPQFRARRLPLPEGGKARGLAQVEGCLGWLDAV